jgi:MFS family permease
VSTDLRVRGRVVLGPRAGFGAVAVALASLYLAAGAPTPLLVVLQQRWDYPTWLLTIAFAVYAVALLVALLVVGSLSDFVGRKPVLLASLAVEVLAMLMFVVAPSIGWIIAARAVQGLATGAATSAFTAALVELAPPRRLSLGPVIASIAPAGGLGLGALVTGVVVQLDGSSARTGVFASLAAVMILALLVLPLTAETTSRRPGALSSLVPRISVPPSARSEFGAAVPVLVAAWMLAGLFLGLVPTILHDLLGRESGLLDGVTVFLEPGTAAVAGLLLGRLPNRLVLVAGGAAALVGALVVLAGVLLTALPLLWVGAVVGGVGFGASFSGALRALGPLAAPHQRAGLVAAVYVIAYLAFGVPVVVAGILDTSLGLLPTVLGYTGALAVVASAGLVVQLRRAH